MSLPLSSSYIYIYMYKILTFICTNSRQVSTCAPKESDFFRLTKDVVRDKHVLEALEKLLCEDAWERRQEGEDLTYDDGSKSKRFQCRSEEILAKVKPLLMPYWREMMPNFDFANVIGWSILWVESGRDALEAHFDELRQWCMAVVFSVGKPGKLVIKTHPGEEAPDEWITREITGNSLYILRGSEHFHKSEACEVGQPGRRGVLVMFVKDPKSWPTTSRGRKQVTLCTTSKSVSNLTSASRIFSNLKSELRGRRNQLSHCGSGHGVHGPARSEHALLSLDWSKRFEEAR